ncbi:MAG: CAP domain-containing protein [Chloroflexota bacterium]
MKSPYLCLLSLAAFLLTFDSLAGPARAQTLPTSTIKLAHPSLRPGQWQSVQVEVRDLAGNPLSGAWGKLSVRYGSHVSRYSIHRTAASGASHVSFKVPFSHAKRATVTAIMTNGYLTIPLHAAFGLTLKRSTVYRPPSGNLQIDVRVLPAVVTPPQPVWIVVYTRAASGRAPVNAPVNAAVLFKEGTLHVTGKTDKNGIATMRVNTSSIKSKQTVQVGVVVRANRAVGSGAVEFGVRLPAQPTPTPSPIPTATSTPVPTLAPIPTPTEILPAPFIPVPVLSPTATVQPVAPSLPTATITPIPVPTDTPTAIPTFTPVPTSTPTPTPTPTLSPTPAPNCPGSVIGCQYLVVSLINQFRGQYMQANPGVTLSALTLNQTQSNGTGSCVGSIGHSQDMAASGDIWHLNAAYPNSSFPNDICVTGSTWGENVGGKINRGELIDLQTLHNIMASETANPSYCATYDNHACNMASAKFHQVGIGIVHDTSGTWLTEDFIG